MTRLHTQSTYGLATVARPTKIYSGAMYPDISDHAEQPVEAVADPRTTGGDPLTSSNCGPWPMPEMRHGRTE